MMDMVVGIGLVVLLLEAARRTIGPALPVIGYFFYRLFLPWPVYAGSDSL